MKKQTSLLGTKYGSGGTGGGVMVTHKQEYIIFMYDLSPLTRYPI